MSDNESLVPAASTPSNPATPAKPGKSSTSNSESVKRTPVRLQTGQAVRDTGGVQGESDDEDGEEDEGPSLETIKAFGRQIQRAPTTSAGTSKVVIPKRGEKDFEPLNETATIQEKMLRESRAALFDGFSGVRGTSSEYAQVQIVRGNLFGTLGHTIRPPYTPGMAAEKNAAAAAAAAAAVTVAGNGGSTTTATTNSSGGGSTMELLPEEALYLLERGSMQIWCAPSVYAKHHPYESKSSSLNADLVKEKRVEHEQGIGPLAWDEQVQGFDGMVEMTAMEAFARFIGQDGLTLERYQVYAGLKRLGYTVHRTAKFLPPRFQKPSTPTPPTTKGIDSAASDISSSLVSPIRRALLALRARLIRVFRGLVAPFRWLAQRMSQLVRKSSGGGAGDDENQTLLGTVNATGYGALYEKLRIVPSGHGHPVTVTNAQTLPTSKQAVLPGSGATTTAAATVNEDCSDPFTSLTANPYLPFFHVWKPNTHWTRGKWDRGSAEGLKTLPPDFWIAVVDARSVPFPTLPQLEEIFPTLPAIPKPFIRSRAPLQRSAAPKPDASKPAARSFLQRILDVLRLKRSPSPGQKTPTPQVNTFLALKQGDRSLIIAVVDGGNVGWTRLGRGGFEDHVMVPNEML
ncbi:hypothetical protein QFC22_006334 [Naganishia vaughanmartiniae]|uniref:Uncharacterized protein n=1 Tax=Naganishia vaughanmartiniae TaxID=1424756 RepID=A0ACC2WLQ3_9TREE|nr:hypothetical protein QFC22_006334 [Naganishia vaughanmartiniae]